MSASTKVVNTILLPGGTPAPERYNVKVRISLVLGGFDTDSVFVGSNMVPEILGQFNVGVKPNGQWEAILAPNEQVSPAGTYYRIEERVGRVPAVYNIIVPPPTIVTSLTRASNQVTATVSNGTTGYQIGDVVTVDVTDGTFAGIFTLIGPVTATTLKWAQTGSNGSDGTGFITKDWDLQDLVFP